MSGLLDVVMGFEGWNPKAYGDYKQWSVGYGTKAKHPGEVIDQEEGKRRLQAELDQARGYVTQKFPNLAPNQADALTSFTYNLGPGWMNQPTRLRAALEKGDMQTATQVMQEYNKAGGEVLPGLVKRRASEAQMFLGGPVSASTPVASSPSSSGVAPSMDTSSSDKPLGLAGLLAQKLNNPLFLMGAGIYSAGSQGKDIGSGILMGSQAAQQAAQAQMQQEAMRRKLAAQQAQDKLWNTLDSNPAVAGMTPEQRQMIKALGPEQGGALLSELIKSQIAPGPQYDFKPAGENLWRVNKKTGQAEPVASAVKPTSDILNWREAVQQGEKRTFQEYQMDLKRAGATAITTDLRAENAEARGLGEGAARRANDTLDKARSASTTIQRLSNIESRLEAVKSGALEPGKATVGAWARALGATDDTLKTLGIDPALPANAQAVAALSNRMVVDMIGSGGFPANNFSDADRAFLERTVPRLANEPQANRIIIETARRIASLDIEKAKAQQAWRKDPANKGKSIDEFEIAWTDNISQRDVLGDLRKAADQLGSSTQFPKPPPQAVDALRKDTSAQARREFDDVFGPGAADRVLRGN